MKYSFDKMLSKYVRPQIEWTPIDEAIYNNETDSKKQKELRFKAIKYAFNLHYYKNKAYYSYCKMMGVNPDDIQYEEDFFKIPLIPDSSFKKYPNDINLFPIYFQNNCSIPINFDGMPKKAFKNYDTFMKYTEYFGYHITFSSSTSGIFSFVLRDKITLDRFNYLSARLILNRMPFENIETLEPYTPDKVRLIGSIPNYENSNNYFLTNYLVSITGNNKIFPDVRWGIKIPINTKMMRIQSGHAKLSEKPLSIMSGLLLPTMLWHSLIKEIKKAEEKIPTTEFVFLPELLSIFMDKMEKKNISFDFSRNENNFCKGILVTGGGFKSAHKIIDRKEMMERIENNFNIERKDQFDFYAANEINFAAIECVELKKHLPFYVKAYALDDDGEILSNGEKGRLAIIDPISNSYPSFILTGDDAIVDDKCSCNLHTQTISDISRTDPTDIKGCGTAFSKLVSGN